MRLSKIGRERKTIHKLKYGYCKSGVCNKQAYKQTTENFEAAAQPDEVKNTAEQDVVASAYFVDISSTCKDAFEFRIPWHSKTWWQASRYIQNYWILGFVHLPVF
jgi:hypothetical protein